MPENDVSVTGDLVLNEYIVNFKVDGVPVSTYTGLYTFPIAYPNDPAKAGFTFAGWDSDIKTMPIGGATINAVFEANSGVKVYTLTYKFRVQYAKDGALAYSDYNDFGTQQYEAGATIIPMPLPSEDGYVCNASWIDLPNTMPAANITVTADLDLRDYTVRFMVDGNTVDIYTGKYTLPIPYPADPVKDGYTFTGWTPNPETMPKDGGIINATFQAAGETDNPDVYFITAETVDAVVKAIREKTGTEDPFTAKEWADLILSMVGVKNITITEV
jgi:hypothetical protein